MMEYMPFWFVQAVDDTFEMLLKLQFIIASVSMNSSDAYSMLYNATGIDDLLGRDNQWVERLVFSLFFLALVQHLKSQI